VQRTYCGEHCLGAFFAQSGTADPASGHIHQRQAVQERSGASPTTVSDRIDLRTARHRLRPVGERLDGDLVLQQRARRSRADAASGQASTRGRKRSVDAGRAHPRDTLDRLRRDVAHGVPVA